MYLKIVQLECCYKMNLSWSKCNSHFFEAFRHYTNTHRFAYNKTSLKWVWMSMKIKYLSLALKTTFCLTIFIHITCWNTSYHYDWLAHCCLKVPLKMFVWICHTFKNNNWMKHKFAKYLTKGCSDSVDEHISLNYSKNLFC